MELAAFSRYLPNEIGRLPAASVIRQYKPVLKLRYDETMRLVTATELGVTRALAAGFGGRTLPSLPEFEEAARPKRLGKPAWMAEFERVNEGRAIQTG